MISKSITLFQYSKLLSKSLAFKFCKAPPQQKITIHVKIDDTVNTYQFPIYTKLAPNLQRVGAPLEFECGFGCSCATCPVKFDQKDYKQISRLMPPSDQQKSLLNSSAYDDTVRLSCQIRLMKEMDGMTIQIQ